MQLSHYLNGLLSNFNDSRTVRNIENLVSKIIEHSCIRIWTISDDKAEFERSRRLLDGSLKSVLDNAKISAALRTLGSDSLPDTGTLIVLHDPCNIRKEHSEKLENLGRVRSLSGDMVNGYSTFNSVAVDPRDKKIVPFDTYVYSNGDDHYVTQSELAQFRKGKMQESDVSQTVERANQIQTFLEEDSDLNHWRISRDQLRQVNQQLKSDHPDLVLRHVFDRQFDDNDYFTFLDKTLEDEFVIRLKVSRNSNQFVRNPDSGKKKYIKLSTVDFAHQTCLTIDKLRVKKKVYKQATCLVEYDKLQIKKKEYTVVRITMRDRNGKMIYKHPMLLITNVDVKTTEQAVEIYHTYLMRAKIEAVFKFLKDVLGWEEFQLEDYEAIKNIIALAFFIAGYFYHIESALVENPTIQHICILGGGKGKVTRQFFLQGLAKMLIHASVERFIKEQGISPDEWADIMEYIKLG